MPRGLVRVLRCGMAGVEAILADTAQTFARHTHDQFGIGVMERGAQRSLSGRGMVEAGPADVITVNPGEVHDGAPIGDHGRSWRILYVAPSLATAAIRDITEDGSGTFELTQPVLVDDRVARRARRLFAAATAGTADLRAEQDLLAVLATLMGRRAADPRPAARLRHAQALIDDDPAAPLSLADLARASGLSRFQVLRAFARTTGLTPHAYLVQRRTQLARRLIARGLPLADAAAASGFADQSHMTRVFVRAYGLSPGAYARALA